MAQGILFAVNIGSRADAYLEDARFAGGLKSRTFRNAACITSQESTHIQWGPSSHFWVDGSITARPNVAFRIRMRVVGSGNGWFRLWGVQYPADNRWREFVVRTEFDGEAIEGEFVRELDVEPEAESKSEY